MNKEEYAKVQSIYKQLLDTPEAKRGKRLDELTHEPNIKNEVLELLKFTKDETIITAKTGQVNLNQKSKKSLKGLKVLFSSTIIFRTTLFVGLSIILFLGLWTHRNVALNLQELRSSELSRTVKALDLSLKNWISDYKHDVINISKDPELRAAVENFIQYQDNKANLTSILNHSIDLNRYSGYAIISLDAQVMLTSDTSIKPFELNPNRRGALAEIINGKTWFGPPISGKSWDTENTDFLRKPNIWVSHLLKDKDNKAIGVLSVARPAEKEFSEIFEVTKLGQTGESYAVNQNGLMLTDSRFEDDLEQLGLLNFNQADALILYAKDPGVSLKEEKPTERKELWPLTKPAQAMQSFSIEQKKAFGVFIEPYRDYRGEKVIGAWTWFPEFRFGIITEIDAKEAYSVLPYITISFVILGLILGTFLIISMFNTLKLVRLSEKANQGKFGHYIIQRQIGEGGMSTVYLASHDLLLRPTALKILKSEVLNQQSLRRFKAEAQQISRLRNPHTIELYDYGQKEDGTLYYAMEFLEGLTIKDLVKMGGPISINRTLFILLRVCYSLKEAHNLNLIHRDIKPLNVMVCVLGGVFDMVKVLDFGLVKDLENSNDEELTLNTEITGTPLYMSPERITTPQKIDHRSDIYALGALAYYMLTAKPIFDYKNDLDVMYQIINTTPTPLNQVNENIPTVLSNLIAVCLDKDQDERPDSIDFVISILNQIKSDYPYSSAEAEEWWDRFKG